MLKWISSKKISYRNKERHLHKKKACQNSKEISKECSKISTGNKLWMQSKDKIRMIIKIFSKRKISNKIIITTCIHKSFTKKNRLIFKELKTYHLNRWKKLNYKKMRWVDRIFSISWNKYKTKIKWKNNIFKRC